MKWANWTALADLSERTKPTSYLEVGVMEGDSLAIVLDHCAPNRLTLCDFWNPAVYKGSSRRNHDHIARLLTARKYEGRANYLDGNSNPLLPKLPADEPFGLIHVDGDHSDAGAAQDLSDCWRVLAPGGHLVFDDLAFIPQLEGVFRRFCSTIGPENSVWIDTVNPAGVGIIQRHLC